MTSPFPVQLSEPEKKDDACTEDDTPASCQDGVTSGAWCNRFRDTSRTPLVTSSGRRHVTRRDDVTTGCCCCCCWRPRRSRTMLRHHRVIEHQVVHSPFQSSFFFLRL